MRGLRQRRRARGLTLVEVLVAAAILSIIFAGITAALLATQRQVGLLSSQTDAQSALRMSLSQIEQAVARAGFGMDPAYALMTAEYGNDGTLGRLYDGTGPFGSDELVVHYRDPGFEATVTAADDAELALSMTSQGSRPLERGERLLVLCSVGLTEPDHSAYVTAGEVNGGPDTYVVGLRDDGDFPFREQDVLNTACFSDGTARAYRIERRHFFISWLNTGDSTGARPALMVSRGIGDNALPDSYGEQAPEIGAGQGESALGDAQILALDVEQLQVAYIMNEPGVGAPSGLGSASDGGASNWVFGDDPNVESEVPHLEREDADNPFPLLDISRVDCIQAERTDPLNGCGYGTRRRFTGHPGNIRGVRVSLAARSARPDYDEVLPERQLRLDALPDALKDGEGPLENLTQGALPPASRHRRFRLQSTITLKNMLQQKHFLQGDALRVAAVPAP